MKNKKCMHITYDETLLYLNPEKALVPPDDNFFDSFEARLDNCPVCQKRLRAFTLLSAFPVNETFAPERVDWMDSFVSRLREAGDICFSRLAYAPIPALAVARGPEGGTGRQTGRVFIKRVGGGLDNSVTVEEGEECFTFTLSVPQALIFRFHKTFHESLHKPIATESPDTRACLLVLCREEDEAEYRYALERSADSPEGEKLLAKTEVLPAGKYGGSVIIQDENRK